MASPTPGVLSKLLDNASSKVTSSSPSWSHRFPLLQVMEIVPCLADDQWRSDRFFVKVSDSLHAAYVAVCAGDDADLIRSDDIGLGQLVYVRGGVHAEKGCPVPVIRGLKPVPKRRPCFGNPSDLVSSDVLLPFTQVSSNGAETKKNGKKKNGAETKRLSLDSARKGWDQTPLGRRDAVLLASPRLRPKPILSDKKALSKNESPSKHLSSDTALKNKNANVSPKPVAKTLKDGVKSSSKAVVPNLLSEVPLGPRTWCDKRILWGALPSTVQMLGKEVLSHRNLAFSAAISALEEASAAEAVLHCLQAFGDLCESSPRLSAGQLVHRFLDIYRSTQSTATVVHSWLNSRSPELLSNNHSSSDNQNSSSCKSMTSKKAASWMRAAIATDLSQFSLFKEPGKHEASSGPEHHYVVIENSTEKRDLENPPRRSKTSPRNPVNMGVKSPPMKHYSAANNGNSKSRCGLKESASLAEKLLRASRQWFLKYLESSLNRGLFSTRGEEADRNASVLIQLKRVSSWLDDLIVNGTENDQKIGDVRKNLHRFLLEHIESSLAETQRHA